MAPAADDFMNHDFSSPGLLYGFTAALVVSHWIFRKSQGLPVFYTQHKTMKRVPGVPQAIVKAFYKPIIVLRLNVFFVSLLVLGSQYPTTFLVRLAIFLVYAPLGALEMCNTCHRSFPMLYILFGLAAFDRETASAWALGSCISFFVNSGTSKLFVGGHNWLDPITMRSYLALFAGGAGNFVQGTTTTFRPLSGSLNRLFRKHDFLCWAISVATFIYECVLNPMLLLIPTSAARCAIGVGGGIAFHVGIAVIQSLYVGADFLPCLPLYLYGYSSSVETLTWRWWLAFAVATHAYWWYILFGTIPPKHWPIDPIPLFAYDGYSWGAVEFFRGANQNANTHRIVFASDMAGKSLVGRRCWPNGDALIQERYEASPHDKDPYDKMDVVWDANGNAFDVTVYEHQFWMAAGADMLRVCKDKGRTAVMSPESLQNVEAWLQKSAMIWGGDGRQLVRAYHVLLDSDGRHVVRVLSSSSGEGTGYDTAVKARVSKSPARAKAPAKSPARAKRPAKSPKRVKKA